MRVLDLFSGIGGFTLGLERAGHETIAFCEIEPFCQAVLKKHWPNVRCHSDIKTLDGREYNGEVDIVCGGFPCQDISLAGKSAGLQGSRSGLFYEAIRIIKEAKPKIIFLENVAALRSRGLEQVLGEISALGYDVQWHCVPASAIGANHQRDRIWILGYSNDYGQYSTKDGESVTERSDCNSQGQNKLEQSTRPGGAGKEDVADATGKQDRRICEPGLFPNVGASSEIPDALRERLERQRKIASRISQELENISKVRWWEVEPDVGRVANGVSLRVDRLRSLGNSIVPQIAEAIGRAIK